VAPGGAGWVNLNAPDVRKFSDADFPDPWTLVDGTNSTDSRCQAAPILVLLEPLTSKCWRGPDSKQARDEYRVALANQGVQRQLAYTVCKMQTEWQAAKIDALWGWLRTDPAVKLGDTDYQTRTAHVKKLCFWDDANLSLPPTHWHFHPREFIKQFRKCGWMAAEELAQCFPRKVGHATRSWNAALAIATKTALPLNLMFRKYNMLSAERQIHFLAQAFVETGFATTAENSRGHGLLYGPFYGRGHIQLTWIGTYKDYGNYRKFPDVSASYAYADTRITHTSEHFTGAYQTDAHGHFVKDADGNKIKVMMQWGSRYDPQIVETDDYTVFDSSAWFCAAEKPYLLGVMGQGVTPTNVGEASVLINGGVNGFGERQSYAAYVVVPRGDIPQDTIGQMQKTFEVDFDSRYVRPPYPGVFKGAVAVDFTPQRP
jgi:hydroxyethylthiazole kinase